jgi:uncharacterized membrane protein
MPTVSRWLVLALGALLSVGIAVVSYRYLVPGLPAAPLVAGNGFRVPWLALHAAAAATALLIGPLQFRSQLRARWPKLHRVLGRVYVTGCLVGGATGLLLAVGMTTGPVAGVGFGALAVVWFFATAKAWRFAVRRELVVHREWMIRSFALTFAAVTVRVYLPLSQALPIGIDDAYRAIAFVSWIPNLIVAELYLRRRRVRLGREAAPAARLQPSAPERS